MNLSTNVTYSLEDEDYDEFRKTGIPITVYLIVLCVLGTIGNVHVFLVYLLRYKSNIYKTFVLCLAAVDFLGCTFCIPASLYIIRHPNTIQSLAFCKINRAITYFVGAYSLLLLDCIAVERYRKVCQATRAQFTIKITRIVCAINFAFVVIVIVIPVTIIYGINQKTTKAHSLTGYECTVLESFKNATLTKIYRGFVFLIFLALVIVSVVLYILIGKKIYTHKNKTSTSSKQHAMSQLKQNVCKSVSSEDGENQTRTSEVEPMNSTKALNDKSESAIVTEKCVITTDPRNPEIKRNKSERENQTRATTGTEKKYLHTLNERKRKKLDRSRNITMIFLVVSILSFGGYLPYLITTLIRNISRSTFENFAENYETLDIFIRWMIFLNNAINPLVYGFMDKKFRSELQTCYVRMARCSSPWS
ncbi:5-hydroxytryptamine receptor 1F-like [Ylistrum balloti]|uniref:5-hydroxytryptamine receptor 1F-like n=1 Tax=Ylistrum balloti TaxID=509963 RepID=UPI002905B444|nr:5-hydroxytryptamine receptor 1F-like [Ylistrum balloti]